MAFMSRNKYTSLEKDPWCKWIPYLSVESIWQYLRINWENKAFEYHYLWWFKLTKTHRHKHKRKKNRVVNKDSNILTMRIVITSLEEERADHFTDRLPYLPAYPPVYPHSMVSRLSCSSGVMIVAVPFLDLIWAATWQNQQNGCVPAKTQISLGIRPVWSECLRCPHEKKGP